MVKTIRSFGEINAAAHAYAEAAAKQAVNVGDDLYPGDLALHQQDAAYRLAKERFDRRASDISVCGGDPIDARCHEIAAAHNGSKGELRGKLIAAGLAS